MSYNVYYNQVDNNDATPIVNGSDGSIVYVTKYGLALQSDGGAAIQVGGHSQISVAGEVSSTEYKSIYAGDYLNLRVVAGGYVSGFYGVESGIGSRIINDGTIAGTIEGIYVGDQSVITNTGTIECSGNPGISTDGTFTLVNSGTITSLSTHGVETGGTAGLVDSLANSGTIIGANVAVSLSEFAGSANVQNSGIIETSDGSAALSLGALADKVSNSGKLLGDVLLGGGADLFDGRNGIVQGTIYGNGGDDTIYGGAGADVIDGGAGADYINGGGGDDTVSYADATAAVSVNLLNDAYNSGDALGDRIVNVENVIGSNYNDTLAGTIGTESLNGGLGNDTLYGGVGIDQYIGGGGSDTVTWARMANAVTVSLAITADQNVSGSDYAQLVGITSLIGSNYNDTLTGDDNANTLSGGAGNDTIFGGGGNDILYGGAGNDVIDGGDGTDTIYYSAAAAGVTVNLGLTTQQNTIGDGLDTLTSIENLTGSAFGDTLTGSAAANTIYGGDGNDVIDGGLGGDKLTGGNGADTFVFDTAPGGTNVDVITDFTVGQDLISFDRSIFKGIAAAGTLAASAFYAGTSAHAAGDRILYDSASGNLFYDADGTGPTGAVRFAQVTPGLALTAASFTAFG